VTVEFVLLIVAAIFFGLAAFGVARPIHFGWAGALALTLSFLAGSL
jgi:hypothetical protein